MIPIDIPAIICMYAPPGSGKTTAIKSLVKYLCRGKGKTREPAFNHILVFCCSPSAFTDYNYIPDNYVYPYFDEEAFDKFVRFQTKTNLPACVIFDDCISSMDFGSNRIRHFLATYRHLNVTVIFASQSVKIGSKALRTYANYSLVWRLPNDTEIKDAASEVLINLANWREAKTLLQRLKKHEFVFVQRDRLDDNYPVMKFEPVRHYQLKY